jgi:outer membrane biosynthesis protein TonB
VVGADAAPREAVFRDLVASHLQHHPRTYTDEMKAWHNKRHTIVALTIDRSGKLVNLELVKAFGSQAADQETLAWLAAAQPYPSIPADLTAPLQLRADLEFGPPGKRIMGRRQDQAGDQ